MRRARSPHDDESFFFYVSLFSHCESRTWSYAYHHCHGIWFPKITAESFILIWFVVISPQHSIHLSISVGGLPLLVSP